jgi:hypothetical protein
MTFDLLSTVGITAKCGGSSRDVALIALHAIRLFFDDPGSALIASIPWILIPCFLVPSLSFVHLIVFYRTLRSRAAADSAVLSGAPRRL